MHDIPHLTMKEISPEAVNTSQQPSDKWVDERLEHERQRRLHKRAIFWSAFILCLLLYFSFFLLLATLGCSTIALQAFLAHKHTLGLALALIVVPSAILWGLVRAVYRVEGPSQASNTTIQELLKTHPFSS